MKAKSHYCRATLPNGQMAVLMKGPSEVLEEALLDSIGDDEVLIGYVSRCDRELAALESNDGEVLVDFPSHEAMQEKWMEIEASGKVCLPVHRQSHGPFEHYYSVARRKHLWDETRLPGFFVPPDDVQDTYREEARTEDGQAPWKKLERFANGILKQYSHYVNGSVYTAVIEHWARDGEEFRRIDHEEVAGLLSLNVAKAELKRALDHHPAYREALPVSGDSITSSAAGP